MQWQQKTFVKCETINDAFLVKIQFFTLLRCQCGVFLHAGRQFMSKKQAVKATAVQFQLETALNAKSKKLVLVV